MKRRELIKNMFIFYLGSSILYSCSDPFSAVNKLNLKNLTFDKNHLKLINLLSKTIVPIHQIPELAEHTSLPFVMKSVNDLYNSDQRINFQNGFHLFSNDYKTQTGKNIFESTEVDILRFLEVVNDIVEKSSESEIDNNPLLYFFKILKKENLVYLRNTEYILKNYRYYEMVPGRFDGDFPIEKMQPRTH